MLTPSNRVLFTAFEWLPWTRRSRMFQPFSIRVMSVCFDICREEHQYLQRYVETRISIFPFLAPRAFLSTSDQLCAIKLSVRRVFSVAVLITSFACWSVPVIIFAIFGYGACKGGKWECFRLFYHCAKPQTSSSLMVSATFCSPLPPCPRFLFARWNYLSRFLCISPGPVYRLYISGNLTDLESVCKLNIDSRWELY